MRYLLMAVVAGVLAWYFFFRTDPVAAEAAAAATPAPISPEQQFQSVLAVTPVDGSQLAVLCSSYPQLGTQLLQGRQIRIKGTVGSVRTSGLADRRAEVVLAGPAPRSLVMIADLDEYNITAVNFHYLGKFEAVGTELLYLLQQKDTLTKKVVVTQGADISQYCALENVGASEIDFQMVNGPVWAGAQTQQ